MPYLTFVQGKRIPVKNPIGQKVGEGKRIFCSLLIPQIEQRIKNDAE